ncbi:MULTISPECIES: RNB domain-containing ribonuclease [unclassified Campylobacter]|uniref:RNB domain-containing ribonuclease n=1 Tax=unclassified Campylobacter TaxID=2593542 RepID=UPI0022EA0654|nr:MULTISPECIES: ribonuclease R family protein [unclassified Campylobacter]MDA3061803.1 ribonuclease R [Campylobacter sp. JMF_14 EL1]MDA3073091.1 ribonuclease R [Campylobacter sp. JMF_10 EL2]
MKEFLSSLSLGVVEKNLNSDQKELVRNLLNLGALSSHKGKIYLNNSYVFGRLDIARDGTGYLQSYDDRYKKDLIIENKYLNGVHLGDIILAKIINSKKARIHAKVLMCVKPAFSSSVVYTKNFGREILGVNVKTSLANPLKATQKSLKMLPPGTLLKIDNLSNEICEVLGNLDDPWVDEKISLAIYNKNDEFNEACKEQALSFGSSVDPTLYPDRVDLQNLSFCTIDPIDAKDFDDAIYYDKKNRIVYVAIADVSEYVSEYSPIDKEAKVRGFSIYFPHKSVPMLPRELSENICSLMPNLPRLAFVFKICLDENLSVISEELFSGIIKSKRRFNYDEVDEILRTKSGCESEILDWLLPLNELCERLRAQRLKHGFDFRTKELRMSIDEAGLLKSTRFESDTPSHKLIEDCMLLANKAAAKRIETGVFRNHGAAELKKIFALLDDLALFGIDAIYKPNLAKMIGEIQAQADALGMREEVDKLIIKAQKRAEYGSISRGHFGLGFDTYTHFTSPIRRYSDLILHRLLKAQSRGDEKFYNYLLLNIDATCERLNELEREADKVAFDFMDRKFARWARENLGAKFRCYIDENANVVTAKLDDKFKGAKIFITNFTADILTPVLVEITDANIASGVIMGRVVKKI